MAFRLAGLLSLLLSFTLSAQDYGDVRLGKATPEELAALPPAIDSAASAYVLYAHQDLRYNYSSGQGFTLSESYHARVKLLTSAGFDRANVALRYVSKTERIGNLRAFIYLPDGEKIKLSGRDFLREDVNDEVSVVKFTFPQVTVGAVIEYAYDKSSESLLTPTPFRFQQDIPVRWAEYTALIPEYFRYVSLGTQGQYAVEENTRRQLKWGPPFRNAPTAHENVNHDQVRWAMREVPAYEQQPYTNNFVDYLPRVRLQLQAVAFPGEIIEPVFNDWHKTAEELSEMRDFGRAYTAKSNYNKLWKQVEPVLNAAATPAEKINAAYDFICKNYRWDGRTRVIGSGSPDELADRGEGNSADFNLALLAILHEAGIPAQPLLVSLRNQGSPVELYPILDQFDHVMVYTEVDGKALILDADPQHRPAGHPRMGALNHRGWVAEPGNPRWVDVEAPKARQVVMATIDFNSALEARIDLQGRQSSYYALESRSLLNSMSSDLEAPLIRDIAAAFPETRVLAAFECDAEKNHRDQLNMKAKLRVPVSLASDDYLYLQPIVLPVLDDELDDFETRLYPIDFPHPWQLQYIANVKVPEGFAVDELPESMRIMSEDGGISATLSAVERSGGLVNLVLQVELNRTVYPAESYPLLREMYSRIIAMQQSNIVFRRAK